MIGHLVYILRIVLLSWGLCSVAWKTLTSCISLRGVLCRGVMSVERVCILVIYVRSLHCYGSWRPDLSPI